MNNEAMMSQVDESQSPDRLAVPTENQVNVAKIRRKLAEDRYEGSRAAWKGVGR